MMAAPIIVICLFLEGTAAFQDITMAQMEYIANHISQADCRRLVASLRSTSSENEKRSIMEGLEIPATTECKTLLVAWSEEDRANDKVLSLVTHRLHQLHYPTLANWLSISALIEVENQLRKRLLASTACISQNVGKTVNSTYAATKQATKVESQQNSSFYRHLGSQAFKVNILIGVLLLGGIVLLILAVKWLVKCCLRYRHRIRGYKNVEYRFEPKPAANIDIDEVYNRYCEC
ncbi:uncharacterized protein LOC135938819 [Cloeon dipterum]|uniref:uncharacterized protein LOC135938819 n=1 Tax=Cloeon dipterum TaxID=197152 RepID=UPI00321FA259